jgi:DNA-binding transcriptional regulator GbsR (MarR family)
MDPDLSNARENFIQGVTRISHFWGFPKAMGAIFGAIYLSPHPLTLDELSREVGISKGAASTNVRHLERLKIIHKQIKVGDRKDYYVAETDFWKIITGVLREREKSEFDHALHTVSDSLDMVENAKINPSEKELAVFYHKRMSDIQQFFDQLDGIVAAAIALDDLHGTTILKWLAQLKK